MKKDESNVPDVIQDVLDSIYSPDDNDEGGDFSNPAQDENELNEDRAERANDIMLSEKQDE